MHLRLALSVFLALTITTTWLMAQPPTKPAPPNKKPLTEEQQARLKERDRLGKEAEKLWAEGKLVEGIGATETKLAIERQALGELHDDVLGSLRQLAALQEQREDFAAARRTRQEVLALEVRRAGGKHWRAIDARLELELSERLARLDIAGRREFAQASALSRQAGRLLGQGKYLEALPLLRQAREIQQRTVGEDHQLYAQTLNQLGILYYQRSEYRGALSYFEQFRALARRLLTEDHPQYASSISNLAILYQNMGDYPRALPLMEQARDLTRRLVPDDHATYAHRLNCLADLYHDLRDYTKSLALHEEALALRKRHFNENPLDYAESLHNMGVLCSDLKAHDKALNYLDQSRHLLKKLLGEDHPYYLSCLLQIAVVYAKKADYKSALVHFEAARARIRKTLGEEHRDYATCLGSLVNVHRALGDYTKALELHQPSLDLTARIFSEDHPNYADTLTQQGYLFLAMGKVNEAERVCRQALAINEAFLGKVFTTMSSRQKIECLDGYKRTLYQYLSAGLETEPMAELYQRVLAWKGLASTHGANERYALSRPELQPLARELRDVNARLAEHARTPPSTVRQRADWIKRFDELEGQKEQLEVRLAAASATFRNFRRSREATVAQVAGALPPKAAFVDYLWYTHYTVSPDRKGFLNEDSRLLAFVLRSGRAPALVQLGSSRPVEQAVQAWQQAVGKYQDPTTAGADLSRLVWQPLEKHLMGVEAIVISPDGPLCSLAFGALLVRRPGGYLLEELAVSYVASGRHLLELAGDSDRPSGSGLLAVGDVSYSALAGSGQTAWASLPGTRLETARVAQVYRQALPGEREARLLTGRTAHLARTKAELTVVAGAPRWRYVHLATHGYFDLPASTGVPKDARSDFEVQRHGRVYGRNPLLMTGLVLARSDHGDEGGTLSAEEVLSLDLWGCDLVVLSACNTGLGKIIAGEGVQGLQQAFQAAGSRSLITSLWRIDDAATTLLMEEFYTNLWQKKLPKLEALRQAQLFVLRHPDRVTERRKELRAELAKRDLDLGKPVPLPDGGKIHGRSHPALWAAFVLSGDTR